MVIEPVKESDHAEWQTLFNAYAQFYKVELSSAALKNTWSWIQDDGQSFWCAVARDGTGTVIGFTHYQLMHRSLSGGMVCYLSDLYVDPNVRGGGTGRALIDYVIAEMRGRGINNVRWLTAEDNATARRLYDSYQPPSGFILYSVPIDT